MHSKHSRRRTCKHAPSHKNQKQLEANFNVQERIEEASEDVDSNLRNTDIPNEVTAEESAEGVQKLRCGDEGARP